MGTAPMIIRVCRLVCPAVTDPTGAMEQMVAPTSFVSGYYTVLKMVRGELNRPRPD